MNHLMYLIFSVLLLFACQAKQTASAVSSEVKQDTVLSRPQFPFPEIPATGAGLCELHRLVSGRHDIRRADT